MRGFAVVAEIEGVDGAVEGAREDAGKRMLAIVFNCCSLPEQSRTCSRCGCSSWCRRVHAGSISAHPLPCHGYRGGNRRGQRFLCMPPMHGTGAPMAAVPGRARSAGRTAAAERRGWAAPGVGAGAFSFVCFRGRGDCFERFSESGMASEKRHARSGARQAIVYFRIAAQSINYNFAPASISTWSEYLTCPKNLLSLCRGCDSGPGLEWCSS